MKMKITVDLPETELSEICEITGISKKVPPSAGYLQTPCKPNAASESPGNSSPDNGPLS